MLHIETAIIVEGKYDKMRLERICDAPIFTTDGFRIFKSREKREFLRRLAETRGILILTDSDRAGFMIRNHIKGFVGTGNIRHAYIPEIAGKERRKRFASKEGKLGVEGIDESALSKILMAYTVPENSSQEKITKMDLYNAGLYGGTDSAAARKILCSKLGIPCGISTSALTDALNAVITKDKFTEVIQCMRDTEQE